MRTVASRSKADGVSDRPHLNGGLLARVLEILPEDIERRDWDAWIESERLICVAFDVKSVSDSALIRRSSWPRFPIRAGRNAGKASR